MRALITSVLVFMSVAIAAAQVDVYAPLPRIWNAEISPEGRWIAHGCSPRGQREICVFDLSGQVSSQLIGQPADGSINGFYWPSEDYLLYWVESFQTITTGAGVQQITFTRVLSWNVETGAVAVLLHDAGAVTGLDDVSSSMVSSPGEVAMEVTFNRQARAQTGTRFSSTGGVETSVFSVDLETGNMGERIHRGRDGVEEFILDENGETLLEVHYDIEDGDYSLRTDRRREVYSGNYPVDMPRVFGRLAGSDDMLVGLPGGTPQLLNLESGEMRPLVLDAGVPDQMDVLVDSVSNRVVAIGIIGRPDVLHYFDTTLERRMRTVSSNLGEEFVRPVSWTQDREKVIARVYDQGQPASFYLLDMTSGGLNLLDQAYVLPEGTRAGERVAFNYTASDGLNIDAWLTLPQGQTASDGPFPLVVLPHGGPRAHDTEAFDWWAAFYASQGYLVMQPNFRGSDNRDMAFIEAGYGGFGTRMIDDMIDGARAVEAAGLARADGYCAAGASYGGYAALMMALRDAENVECVVAFAAVTAPFNLFGRVGGDSQATRFWEQYIGTRFSEDAYRNDITPRARARELTLPILMIHGDQDTTVPLNQMTGLEVLMDHNPQAAFLTLQGEDHHLSSTWAREMLLTESGNFLRQHLPVE